MQIEAQALVSDRVKQDPSDTRLPATAWPRQTLAVMYATPRPLPESGRGDYDPPLAGISGKGTGQVFALGWTWSRVWWYRLGCRARSFPT